MSHCAGLLSIPVLTHVAVVSPAGMPFTAGTLSRSSRTGLSLDPDALQHLRSPYNVYIKGLPASATDDQLRAWASGIAEPLSIKTIRELRNESMCSGIGAFVVIWLQLPSGAD